MSIAWASIHQNMLQRGTRQMTDIPEKFKLSQRELLQFNDDCNEAAHCCPQYRGGYGGDDRDILLGNITTKQVVKSWLECDVLWNSGYSAELSTFARDVFKRYGIWKAYKKVRRYEKSLGQASTS